MTTVVIADDSEAGVSPSQTVLACRQPSRQSMQGLPLIEGAML
jgi:hypothetical protein